MDMNFGNLFRRIRLRNKMGLKEYCSQKQIRSERHSRIENGIAPPPNRAEGIMRMLYGMDYTELELYLLVEASRNYHTAMSVSKFNVGENN